MSRFVKRTGIPVPAEDVYAWHARPGAFARLTPPWERVQLLQEAPGLHDGARAVLAVGPLKQRWVAEHRDVRPGASFRDVQVSGPFARWDHEHRMVPAGPGASVLEDEIEYRLPVAPLSDAVAGWYVRGMLERMFRYRHRVTHDDLVARASWPETWREAPRTVAITGASGLVGSALVPALSTAGHRPVPVVRGPSNDSEGVRWDPGAGTIDAGALEGIDAVVHLAGESIAGGRWTDERKRRIVESRVRGTSLLARTLAALRRPPRVLVCASAIGYYGDRGDERVDEESPPGRGFLAATTQQWEEAADPARSAGIRVVHMRTGIVLTPAGGALQRMLPPFRMGVGGPLGHGRQYMSWIAMDDLVASFLHALTHKDVDGAVNAVAPHPARNATFARTLGDVLGRPAILPAPAPVLRLMMGEMAEELLLTGAQVLPQRLMASGYEFRFPGLEGALRHVLGRGEVVSSPGASHER